MAGCKQGYMEAGEGRGGGEGEGGVGEGMLGGGGGGVAEVRRVHASKHSQSWEYPRRSVNLFHFIYFSTQTATHIIMII